MCRCDADVVQMWLWILHIRLGYIQKVIFWACGCEQCAPHDNFCIGCAQKTHICLLEKKTGPAQGHRPQANGQSIPQAMRQPNFRPAQN